MTTNLGIFAVTNTRISLNIPFTAFEDFPEGREERASNFIEIIFVKHKKQII